MDYSTSQANVAYSTSDVPLEGIAQALDESEYIVVRQGTNQQLQDNEYVITHGNTGHPSIRFTENTDYDGLQFRVSRVTDLESLRNTFYPGANLRSQDLNSNFQQSLQATQEVYGSYLSRYGGEIEGNLSFNANVGGRLTGLQNPTVDDEAANKVYADGVRALVAEDRQATLGFKNEAETARDDAASTKDFLNGIYLGTFDSATDPAFYNASSNSYFNPYTNVALDEDDEGAFYFNNDSKLSYVWDGSEFLEAIQPPLVPFNQTFKANNTYTTSDLFNYFGSRVAVYEIDVDADGNSLSFPTNVSKVLVEVNGELLPPGAVLLTRDLVTGDALSVLISLAQPGTPLVVPQPPSDFPAGVPFDPLESIGSESFTDFLTPAQVTALTTDISSTRINIVAFGQSVFGAAGWQDATFSNGQINLISRTNPELNLTTDDLRPTLTTENAVHTSTTDPNSASVSFTQIGTDNEYRADFTIPYAKPDSFSIDSTTYFPTLGFSDGTTVTSNISIRGPAPTLFNDSAGFTVSNSTTAPSASLTQRAAPNDTEYDFNVVFPNINLDASNVTTLAPTDSATASLSYASGSNQYELSLGLPQPSINLDASNVTTLAPANAATASLAYVSANKQYELSLGLPQPNINLNASNVSTLAPASPATAALNYVSANNQYELSLGLPQPNIDLAASNVSTLSPTSPATASLNYVSANNQYDLSLGLPQGHTPTFQTGTTAVEDSNNTPGISFSSAGTGSSGEPLYDINSVLPIINLGSTVSVQTLNPGSSASASIAQDANFATNRTYNISLGIPKGDLPVLSAGTATMDSGNSFNATVGGTAANPTVDITLPRPVVFWTNSTTPPTGADHQLGINTTSGQIFQWINGSWSAKHNPLIPFTWKGRVLNYTDLSTTLTAADKGETWTVTNAVTTITPNAPENTTFYWDGSAWANIGNLAGETGPRGLKVIPIVAYANGSGTGIQRQSTSGCVRHEKTTTINGELWDLKEGDLGVVFGSGEIYRFEMIDGDSSNSTYGENERGDVRYDKTGHSNTYFGNVAVPASGTSGCTYTERTPVWVKIGTINTGMVFGALYETAPVVNSPASTSEASSLPVTNAGETIGENGVFVEYSGYGVTYKRLIRASGYGTSANSWWYQWENINGTHWTGRGTIGIGATLPAIQTGANTDDTPPANYNLGSLFILTSGNTGTFYNLGTYTHANGHVAYQWVSTGTSMNLGGGLPSSAGIVKTDGTTASTINTDGIVRINNGTVSTHNVNGLVKVDTSFNTVTGITFPSSGIVTSDGSSFGNITNNSTDWNTAHSWGDHALAGYYKDGSSFADYAEDRTVDIYPPNNTANKTLTNATPLYYYQLGGNITITLNLNVGESIQLALLLNGYTPTFSGVTWVGGSAPSSLTTSSTVTHVFEFWNVTGSTSGAYVGAVY